MGLMTERMTERTERVCPTTQDMVGIKKSHGSGEENTSCYCWGTDEFVRLKYVTRTSCL